MCIRDRAQAFRAISKVYDPTRAVTQNHLGSDLSSDYLDVQGFSHKQIDVFEKFHKAKPGKPMMATECCSCMSQRGVDLSLIHISEPTRLLSISYAVFCLKKKKKTKKNT
eukprot:TRINITY_DN5995_c0_g1_i2.p1 TRINITY_DN5995_c0_g1~~TRINITY_DN5995_c0_g1_i2.p1  ORF type:complete len:110 (-),score=33.81 TRINITY_DN5995_c0_g1_i2:30-359(-)